MRLPNGRGDHVVPPMRAVCLVCLYVVYVRGALVFIDSNVCTYAAVMRCASVDVASR